LQRLQRVSDVKWKVPLAFVITVPGLCACIIGMSPYFESNPSIDDSHLQSSHWRFLS
jgi:hypothetical protein